MMQEAELPVTKRRKKRFSNKSTTEIVDNSNEDTINKTVAPTEDELPSMGITRPAHIENAVFVRNEDGHAKDGAPTDLPQGKPRKRRFKKGSTMIVENTEEEIPKESDMAGDDDGDQPVSRKHHQVVVMTTDGDTAPNIDAMKQTAEESLARLRESNTTTDEAMPDAVITNNTTFVVRDDQQPSNEHTRLPQVPAENQPVEQPEPKRRKRRLKKNGVLVRPDSEDRSSSETVPAPEEEEQAVVPLAVSNPKKPNRTKNGHKALREILEQQRELGSMLAIPTARVIRMLRRTIHEYTDDVITPRGRSSFRLSRHTVYCVHELLEAFLTRIFEDANLAAIHARRVTVMPRDIHLVMALRKMSFGDMPTKKRQMVPQRPRRGRGPPRLPPPPPVPRRPVDTPVPQRPAQPPVPQRPAQPPVPQRPIYPPPIKRPAQPTNHGKAPVPQRQRAESSQQGFLRMSDPTGKGKFALGQRIVGPGPAPGTKTRITYRIPKSRDGTKVYNHFTPPGQSAEKSNKSPDQGQTKNNDVPETVLAPRQAEDSNTTPPAKSPEPAPKPVMILLPPESRKDIDESAVTNEVVAPQPVMALVQSIQETSVNNQPEKQTPPATPSHRPTSAPGTPMLLEDMSPHQLGELNQRFDLPVPLFRDTDVAHDTYGFEPRVNVDQAPSVSPDENPSQMSEEHYKALFNNEIWNDDNGYDPSEVFNDDDYP